MFYEKATFRLNSYLYKFTDISPNHRLELFDKLVALIMNYSADVWGFGKADKIETVHLQFCKRLPGVKRIPQNDFVYVELGQTSFQTKRYLTIIKYWLKIVLGPENRLIKTIYKMMLNDMESMPHKENWAKLVKQLLGCIGFNEVWVAQTVGDANIFLSLVKQRLHDNFIQIWNSRLRESSRASFYSGICCFHYKHYLYFVSVKKYVYSVSIFRPLGLCQETNNWIYVVSYISIV